MREQSEIRPLLLLHRQRFAARLSISGSDDEILLASLSFTPSSALSRESRAVSAAIDFMDWPVASTTRRFGLSRILTISSRQISRVASRAA
nr:hypothetical protein [Burkholderia sp.]